MSKAPKNGLLTSSASQQLPGPGSYASSKKFGSEARKAFLTGKPSDIHRNDSPGPGKYDVRDAMVKCTSP